MTTPVLVPESHREQLERLVAERGLDVELRVYDEGRLGPWPGVEVFFSAWPSNVRREALEAAPDVRWVQSASAGVDRLIDETAGRGIVLTESGVCYREPIGEFVLALMLHHAKGLGTLWDRHRAGVWRGLRHRELAGRTVGIVGLGPIGLGVAERAAANRMRVIGCRRSGAPIEDVRDVVGPDAIDRLWRESDYIAITCPLTDETRGLVDARALGMMKPDAVIVNIARGAIIDTDALVEALRAGRLGGAMLDVTDPEPLSEGHPLWRLPGVFITPHVAGGGDPALYERIDNRFLDNLERYLAGEPLDGLVDPARGY